MSDAVAIVGAGVAGCAAAYALRDAPVDATVFEASDEVSGRAATRQREACTYEYGANYLPGGDERVTRLVTEELDGDGLLEVTGEVRTFDADGAVSEGRDDQEDRWTYDAGLAELGRRLLAPSDATVRTSTPIDGFTREDGRWRLRDAAGEDLGAFDAVVPTPPAPLTADLLGRAAWDHRDCRELREAIAAVPYRTVTSVACHYPFEVDVPYYALVAEDDEGDGDGEGRGNERGDPHHVGWIGREECKPGRVPDGESLLLVQLAPEWSAEHYHDDDRTILRRAAEGAAELLDDDRLAEPDWADVERWRYALPDEGLGEAALATAREHDLYFAGDWVTGEARLHAAIRSGMETGVRLRSAFE